MTIRRSMTFIVASVVTLLILGGCGATKKAIAIPPGANNVRTGRGELIEYKSDRSGMLYIFDEDEKDVIYKQEIARSDEVKLDPKAGTLTINDKDVAAGTKLVRNHRYNLYLK